MSDEFTVIVSAPDVDGAVAGALVGRAAQGRAEALVFDSEDLVAFFRPEMQQKLPRGYDLVICGPGVVQSDWEGRSVRPALMDALRAARGPVRWFSARRWDSEDRRAVAHIIGEECLRVSDGARPAAQLVREEVCDRADGYADRLVRFVRGDLSDAERRAWGSAAGMVLEALKADREQLAAAIALLMEGHLQDMIGRFEESARRTDEDSRTEARRQVGNCRKMRGVKLVLLNLAPPRHPFWAEVSRYARQEAGAEVSLCALEGRSVLLIGRETASQVDLAAWARYVTDMLPAARAIGRQPDVVTLYVQGLAEAPQLRDEVVRLMEEGAHLLRR